jgi:glycosyl hydrolase family 123
MKQSILIIAATIISVQPADAQPKKITGEQLNDIVTCVAVDPLQKIFKETAFFDETDATADVARGEHASFQFALRSNKTLTHVTASVVQLSRNRDLLSKNTFVGFVGYTRVGRPLPNPPKDKLNPISGFYPDPIFDTTSMDIRNFTTQPIWITVNIPVDFPPGEYAGLLTIKANIGGQRFSFNRPFTVRVYNVAIAKTSLWVTNWFALGKNQLKQLSGGKDSVEFFGNYWKWLHVVAKKMKEYDQNVIMTPVFALTGITVNKDKFFFEFSKFDQFVQTFIDEGTLGRIEGGHIGGRMGNWYAQFGVITPYFRNDSLKFKNMAITDSSAQNFYSQFIPALVAHLKEKGWDKIYLQHICDEPEPGNEKTYADIASYIKSISPDIKIIDAVHSHGVNNTVDVWVPELEMYDSNYNFYTERKNAGNEIWFYTCLAPQGDYANRFIELPLIKTRILHWINFRFGATGYLHWGWDFWSDNCLEETAGIIPEAGNIMPGGDAFITYPGNGKILSSIRLEAMRDGIVDYELLKLLEEKKPAIAKEICRQVVYEFAKYDTDIKSFRAKRKFILQQLAD